MDVDIDDGTLDPATNILVYQVTVQVTDQKNRGIEGEVWHTERGVSRTDPDGFFGFTFEVPVSGKTLQVRLVGTRAMEQFRLLGPKPPRPALPALVDDVGFWERLKRGWKGYKE